MAEEKQLTVAELLARARQENPDEAKAPSNEQQPKRRRRRNLEDGGVSVAELTGSFRAVQAAPAESKHSSVPMDEPEEPEEAPKTTEAPEAEKPEKAEQPETPAEPEKPEKAEKSAETVEPAVGQPGESDTTDKPAAPSPSSEETGVIGKVNDEPKTAAQSETQSETSAEPTEAKAGETADEMAEETTDTDTWQAGSAEATDTAQAEQSIDDGEPGRTNAGTVILLAFVGVVVGVVIFLGFQFMWGQFNLWLVAILAIVVTVAMIFGVRAMRTASDGLSMTLAGLVGLVVTFGPAALVLL